MRARPRRPVVLHLPPYSPDFNHVATRRRTDPVVAIGHATIRAAAVAVHVHHRVTPGATNPGNATAFHGGRYDSIHACAYAELASTCSSLRNIYPLVRAVARIPSAAASGTAAAPASRSRGRRLRRRRSPPSSGRARKAADAATTNNRGNRVRARVALEVCHIAMIVCV